ncbi:MAG: Rieske 2Fe-2S domain-containing protein [Proteobacteria bacterium]|nr:Rieske 2Fe-2S domain-containing protein [Pseudomonadota bacterium]
MLRHDDNERLVRVGPGTPAGELFRRYWQPALLASEVAETDGAPVRVRLLSEDLIAFRDSEGRVGLVDAYCPHRRAPMFYGRNEECGLRCVYHGWKFDVDGNCTDLPSEPADSPMKAKASIKSYPTFEKGGVIWAYLGPAEQKPPVPDYEWTRAPQTHRHVSKTYEACNYLQGLEGGLDTSHSSYLHRNQMQDPTMLRTRDGAPKITVNETDYGYNYVSDRNLGDDGHYVRVYHYIMPFQQMRANTTRGSGGRANVPKMDGHLWVPIDDYQTNVYNWMCGYDESAVLTEEFIAAAEKGAGRGVDELIPGTFQLKRNPSNDYLIDREVQKDQTFTGITGVNTQDFALQEGMGYRPEMGGAICDRSEEYLGTSDRAIITMRKLMLEAIKTAENGGALPGLDPDSHGKVRPHDTIVPKGAKWEEHMLEELVAKW